jgi:hypothetical protein
MMRKILGVLFLVLVSLTLVFAAAGFLLHETHIRKAGILGMDIVLIQAAVEAVPMVDYISWGSVEARFDKGLKPHFEILEMKSLLNGGFDGLLLAITQGALDVTADDAKKFGPTALRMTNEVTCDDVTPLECRKKLVTWITENIWEKRR